MPMRDATGSLLRAITAQLAGNPVRFERIHSRDWASGAFAAMRHQVELHIGGEHAQAAADAFVLDLGEREFDLGRYLLADIEVIADVRDATGVRLTVEALTIDNC